MKSKLFSLFAIVTLMTVAASAQIGRADLTLLPGGPFHHADGVQYSIYYSPSSIIRSGDWVVVSFDVVFPDGQFPTKSYAINTNCRTDQYTFAVYDTTTTPPTLGAASEVKTIIPGTMGTYLKPVVCK